MNDERKDRILLVDDDLGVLKLLIKTLSNRYDLLVAPTGYELEVLINHYKPDLIIMDLCLPEENGQTVSRHLRQQSAYDSIAILFLSGLAEPKVAAAAIQAGVDGYLTKPFNIHVLRNTIAHIIQTKRGAHYSASV